MPKVLTHRPAGILSNLLAARFSSREEAENFSHVADCVERGGYRLSTMRAASGSRT